jgi:hypothetical protein
MEVNDGVMGLMIIIPVIAFCLFLPYFIQYSSVRLMMKKSKSEPKKSSNPVQQQAKTAYFSEQLQALWQICPDLGTFKDFSKLAGTTSSTISKIVSGKSKTKASRVIGRFLPVFITYGAVTNAEDARRLIEPSFHLIKKDELKTIWANILERRYPSLINLSKADRDNVKNFASTIDESYCAGYFTHPA